MKQAGVCGAGPAPPRQAAIQTDARHFKKFDRFISII